MISTDSMATLKSNPFIKAIPLIIFALSFVLTIKATELNDYANNATIFGKVFRDTNRNGIQDANEHGIPGVRLATVTGLVIETDGYGRYHIPDNKINLRFARNYILKIDETSLPTGSVIQSENPRAIRITSSSAHKINFSVNY